MATVLKIHIDGTVERLEAAEPIEIDWLRGQIGGEDDLVERVVLGGVLDGHLLIGLVDESGRVKGLPDNRRYPNLCGVIVIVSERFVPDDSGGDNKWFGLSEPDLKTLEAGGGIRGWTTPYLERTRTLEHVTKVIILE